MSQELEDKMTKGSLDGSPEDGGDIRVKQDGYRHVMFGQIADGLLPPHRGAPESTDDELSQAAMSDPAAAELDAPQYQPTPWRIIFILAVAAISLAIVFWK